MKKNYKEALKAHFDASSCEMLNFAEHSANIVEIFGYPLKKATLARLSGSIATLERELQRRFT